MYNVYYQQILHENDAHTSKNISGLIINANGNKNKIFTDLDKNNCHVFLSANVSYNRKLMITRNNNNNTIYYN